MDEEMVALAMKRFQTHLKDSYGQAVNVQTIAAFAKLVEAIKSEMVKDYKESLDRLLSE